MLNNFNAAGKGDGSYAHLIIFTIKTVDLSGGKQNVESVRYA